MNLTASTAVFETPVGPLFACVEDGKLTRLSFLDRSGARTGRREGANQTLDAVMAQIGEYFAGKRKDFELPLRFDGPEFHRKVWTALCDIPYGKTIS